MKPQTLSNVAVRLPMTTVVSATLLEILIEHYTLKGADDPYACATSHAALLEGHIRDTDPLTQFEDYVVAQWGDGQLPQSIKDKLGPEDQWTERERQLVGAFKELRSDYLLATGIGGECGEVLEELKKSMREGVWRTDKVKDESGDLFYYVVANLRRQGLRVRDVLAHTMEKLNSRRGEPDYSTTPPWADGHMKGTDQ